MGFRSGAVVVVIIIVDVVTTTVVVVGMGVISACIDTAPPSFLNAENRENLAIERKSINITFYCYPIRLKSMLEVNSTSCLNVI